MDHRKTIKSINNLISATDDKTIVLKPFLKWAGGKGQLLKDIRNTYPEGLGTNIKKYAEPFVGGGAVFFDVLSAYKLDSLYISDINAELINTYRIIRDEKNGLLELLEKYSKDYIPLEEDNRKEYYYIKRHRFNDLKKSSGKYNNIEMAAVFIFLNRTCFNGLYRVNKKGGFNVPMGSYKNPNICDKENLLNISDSLSNVEIINGDYKEVSSFIDSNTFVYIDPPYRPINTTSTFTAYTENGFDDCAQRELATFVNVLTERGAKVILSNSDPKNENMEDEFFDELYSLHKINRVDAARIINSKAKARGKIKELLICNF